MEYKTLNYACTFFISKQPKNPVLKGMRYVKNTLCYKGLNNRNYARATLSVTPSELAVAGGGSSYFENPL